MNLFEHPAQEQPQQAAASFAQPEPAAKEAAPMVTGRTGQIGVSGETAASLQASRTAGPAQFAS
eukprot:6202906-Lingulodinium_polyedra.AAC.1